MSKLNIHAGTSLQVPHVRLFGAAEFSNVMSAGQTEVKMGYWANTYGQNSDVSPLTGSYHNA
ncbi:hypothetical protein JCM12294_06610 [Desulfocicer niacini]